MLKGAANPTPPRLSSALADEPVLPPCGMARDDAAGSENSIDGELRGFCGIAEGALKYDYGQ